MMKQVNVGTYLMWVREELDDEGVIDEVVRRDVYRVKGLPLAGRTVIDCGAHIGSFTMMCAANGARVIAVEPNPDSFAVLQRNVVSLEPMVPPDHIHLVNAALGDRNGTTQVSGLGGQSTTLRGGVDVDMHPLGWVFEEWQIRHVAVLKLDMEGAEGDVLLSTSHDILGRCDRIVMESHGPDAAYVDDTYIGALVEHLLYTHSVEVSGTPRGLGVLFARRYAG